MFITSYNTYISTNTTDRTQKSGALDSKSSSNSFKSNLLDNPVIESKSTQNLPISYISNYKAFNNKQKLQQEIQNPDGEKFSKIKTMQNMKTAYSDNSKVFSLLIQPGHTLNKAPKIDLKLPKDIQELKEQNMRRTMVNTYLENDKYYLITA